MEKKFIIIFTNGYCGCEVEEEIIGTFEQAKRFAQKYLSKYANNYAYRAFGWFGDYSNEAYDKYFDGCIYYIVEEEE